MIFTIKILKFYTIRKDKFIIKNIQRYSKKQYKQYLLTEKNNFLSQLKLIKFIMNLIKKFVVFFV